MQNNNGVMGWAGGRYDDVSNERLSWCLVALKAAFDCQRSSVGPPYNGAASVALFCRSSSGRAFLCGTERCKVTAVVLENGGGSSWRAYDKHGYRLLHLTDVAKRCLLGAPSSDRQESTKQSLFEST